MRFVQLYLAVLAALVSVAVADVMRVPLRKRAHSGHRLLDRNGRETDVVDMSALRRSINHVNRRYGGQDEQQADNTLDKRWVNPNVLTKEINLAFTKEEDDIQNSLVAGLKDIAGKLWPNMSQDKDGEEAVSVAQSKSKYRAASKDKGRYTGAEGSATSSIALKDNVSGGTDIEFVGDISIGTPAQKFPIDPDTGSADLWVVDKGCTASDCGPDSRGKFVEGQSSTYKPVDGQKFDLQYGIGDVSGRYARETVNLGGITIQKQTIGLANHTSPDWKDDLASGVLGLGFRSITSNNQRPIIQNLATQGKLKRKIISFAFGRHASGTEGKSEMRIGATNKNLYKGKISYYPLTKVAYWQAKFKSFSAGKNGGVQNVDGIFDTGTSLIAAPASIASTFWKGVQGAKLSSDGSYYAFPCDAKINARLSMPDGTSFKLDEKDVNIGRESSGSSQCVGAVIVASTPGQIIFGLAALKNFYQVYDFGQNRIGMAKYNF